MTEQKDWLFEALWELSDQGLKAGFPGVAEKLEEAMDAYLAEVGAPGNRPVVFKSCRSVRARRRQARARTEAVVHQLAERRRKAGRKDTSAWVPWNMVSANS